jgi:hypothetical protein
MVISLELDFEQVDLFAVSHLAYKAHHQRPPTVVENNLGADSTPKLDVQFVVDFE